MLWSTSLPTSITLPALLGVDTLYISNSGSFLAFTPDSYDDTPWFETETFFIISGAGAGGGLVCLMICVVGLFCGITYVRRRRQLKEALNNELVNSILHAGELSDEESPLLGESSLLDENCIITKEGEALLQKACKEKWFISFKGLILQQKIAVGGVGTIYRAKWRGTDVAVKVCSSPITPRKHNISTQPSHNYYTRCVQSSFAILQNTSQDNDRRLHALGQVERSKE